jgi:hypothetical protein
MLTEASAFELRHAKHGESADMNEANRQHPVSRSEEREF